MNRSTWPRSGGSAHELNPLEETSNRGAFAPLADVPAPWLNTQMTADYIKISDDDEARFNEGLRGIMTHKPVEKSE